MNKTIYNDLRASSGITHFSIHPDAVTIHYGAKKYTYSHASAGKEHVDTMKRLAATGAGLASYVSAYKPDHVQDKE